MRPKKKPALGGTYYNKKKRLAMRKIASTNAAKAMLRRTGL